MATSLGECKRWLQTRCRPGEGLTLPGNLLHLWHCCVIRYISLAKDWLILTACQLVLGYFMPRGPGIPFILLLYAQFSLNAQYYGLVPN